MGEELYMGRFLKFIHYGSTKVLSTFTTFKPVVNKTPTTKA
jgi:hypothetical protein